MCPVCITTPYSTFLPAISQRSQLSPSPPCRQADDHSHLLTEQDGKLANQASFIMDLAGKVDGLDSWSQTAQEGSSKQDQSLAQVGRL